MTQPCRYLPRLLLFVFAFVILGTGEAQAKRVPKLYTFGPANSEMGPIKKGALAALPAEVRAPFEALGVDTVGFHYQHFGLFYLVHYLLMAFLFQFFGRYYADSAWGSFIVFASLPPLTEIVLRRYFSIRSKNKA